MMCRGFFVTLAMVRLQFACEMRDDVYIQDISWDLMLGDVYTEPVDFDPYAPIGEYAANTTTNILFSSGTTGEPKAIPWTHVTPIRSAIDGLAHHDIRPGDVVCWPTNLVSGNCTSNSMYWNVNDSYFVSQGWMMGPWLVYASLLNSATIALFEGSPLGEEFCGFVEKAHVTMLGLVPSLAKVWRRSGVTNAVDWSRIRFASCLLWVTAFTRI